MNAKQFNLHFFTKRCSSLSNAELEACSKLYSENYGTWSGKGGTTKGKRIVLSPKYYAAYANNPNMYVSLCYEGDILLGQCFYLRKTISGEGLCTWITQLVVHRFYRKRNIGTRLLQSAWGFSNYFAWGLATTNAVTIKTLESVTWRQVDPEVIKDNLSVIENLCDEISFADKNGIVVGKGISQLDSKFFPDFQKLDRSASADVYVAKLGEIRDGYEWLAFTFQSQNILFNQSHFNKLLDFSASQLQDAYGRMAMENHSWTKSTQEEVEFIIDKLKLASSCSVLDMGCGTGRHSIEFAKRGYTTLGLDFSERLYNQAKNKEQELNLSNLSFKLHDCRTFSTRQKFDAVICLYDVIGSFRTQEENNHIIDAIYKALKSGGKAVISVMNMELTESLAINCGSVRTNPEKLLTLKASNIMQTTGNVFNPEHFFLDINDHLVYRKEQFEMDGLLSAEYLVADYRYRKSEIENIFKCKGFKIVDSFYAQSGKWNVKLPALDIRAKEIVLIAEKI